MSERLRQLLIRLKKQTRKPSETTRYTSPVSEPQDCQRYIQHTLTLPEPASMIRDCTPRLVLSPFPDPSDIEVTWRQLK